jgi:hypothetical protein
MRILITVRWGQIKPSPWGQLRLSQPPTTECVREGSPFRDGPLASLAARLMHRLDRRPPVEVETEYYAQQPIGLRTGHR